MRVGADKLRKQAKSEINKIRYLFNKEKCWCCSFEDLLRNEEHEESNTLSRVDSITNKQTLRIRENLKTKQRRVNGKHLEETHDKQVSKGGAGELTGRRTEWRNTGIHRENNNRKYTQRHRP